MNEEDERSLVESQLKAAEGWPIERRLRYVRGMIFGQFGSTTEVSPMRPREPRNFTMYTAVDILDGVLEILKDHPEIGKLPTPKA